MKRLGLIGFGDFGQFIMPYLREYFAITVYDSRDLSSHASELNIGWGELEEVADCEIVILAVPVQNLKTVLKSISPMLNPGTVVIDVSSVKVKPIELMQEILPNNVELVGLHPLFGPQSGKLGIEGLNIVVCPVRSTHDEKIASFLAEELKLKVFVRSPEEHDQEMAYVQGVTHFVVRAMKIMNLPHCELSTPAYDYLVNIHSLLGKDSQDLFVTIQNENPYAKPAREKLIQTLQGIEDDLD